MRYSIHAVEKDLDNLLLVAGGHVVNGAYDVRRLPDGSYGNGVNGVRSYKVMDLPFPVVRTLRGVDYNATIEKARAYIREKGIRGEWNPQGSGESGGRA